MQDKKVALVTGANKGIGKEIARQLGHLGMTVLIGARDKSRGTEAVQELNREGLDAHYVLLDVTDPATVAAAAAQIEQEFGKLDVLVNNAGVALDSVPPSQTDVDTLRQTYETNVFGVVAVTNAILPLLKKSDAPRIVNISSGLGSLSRASDPNSEFSSTKLLAYNSSKAALNMITVLYAAELKGLPFKINAACPGYTASDLNQYRGSQTVAQGAVTPVRLATLPADGPTGGLFNEQGPVAW